MKKTKLLFCINNRWPSGHISCGAQNSEALLAYAQQRIESEQLNIPVEATVCMGRCSMGPTIKLVPGRFVQHGTTAIVDTLIDELLRAQQITDKHPPAADGSSEPTTDLNHNQIQHHGRDDNQ